MSPLTPASPTHSPRAGRGWFEEPGEGRIFWLVASVCAVSRFAARARSLWDWDEALFCLGMRSFDVTQHHPHPPGFPAYIALGRMVRLFVHDDFRSLQTINLVAGMLLFPAVFFLARRLRMRFSTSVVAGALCAFFPNVWFYGGTAFSDVPSITIVVFAAALLLQSAEADRAGGRLSYLGGVFLLAISMAIRPQNALVGVFPLLLAARRRSLREVAAGAGIGIAVVAAAFGGAIAATGSYEAYRSAILAHSAYISQVDSFRSPLRPPLWRLIALFFAKQYSSPALSIITTIFVLISMAGALRTRNRSMLYNALIFGPVAIAAWLFLDRYSVNRFSIGYCPMFAIFAADGIARLEAWSRRRLEIVIATLLILGFIAYAYPTFTPVRRDIAPSVLAMEAAKAHFNPQADDLFVAADMRPFVEYFMPGVAYVRVLDERAMVLSTNGRTPRLIAEIIATSPDGFVFRRTKGRLWNISRRHYYGAAYATVTRFAKFASGWYPPERSGHDEWRWIAGHATAILPESRGESLLRLQVTADPPANVTVSMNGVRLDAFDASGDVLREWHIHHPNDGPNTLEITASRDHAVHVRALSWAAY